jgi:hypothetical protein
MADTSEKKSWIHRLLATGSVVVVLTITGLIADLTGIVGFATGKSGPDLVAPRPTATSPAPAPTTGTTATTPPPAESSAPPENDAPVADAYVTDLDLLNKGLDVDSGAVELKGDHYGHSVVYRCSDYCNEPRGAVEINLGGHYSTFEAVAGVLDDAQDATQVGHFEVFVDGRSVKEVTASLGKPAHVRVTLPKGAMRLKLLAYRDDTVDSPLMAGVNIAGGTPNNLPELAWGNPQLGPATTGTGG